jgi:hypothetical protein
MAEARLEFNKPYLEWKGVTISFPAVKVILDDMKMAAHCP